MIPVLLIISTAFVGSAAVGVVAAFWDNIKHFLKWALEKVKETVSGIVHGCKVFIEKTGDGIKEISRYYSKEGKNWTLTTISKSLSESEVPPEFLERTRRQKEVDITGETEHQLELTA